MPRHAEKEIGFTTVSHWIKTGLEDVSGKEKEKVINVQKSI